MKVKSLYFMGTANKLSNVIRSFTLNMIISFGCKSPAHLYEPEPFYGDTDVCRTFASHSTCDHISFLLVISPYKSVTPRDMCHIGRFSQLPAP